MLKEDGVPEVDEDSKSDVSLVDDNRQHGKSGFEVPEDDLNQTKLLASMVGQR
jgi:hypothetical protein